YDQAEVLRVSQIVRASAGHEPVIDELVGLYEEVMREFAQNGHCDKLAEDRAAAGYLRQLKIDITANSDAAARLRERLARVPVVGGLSVKLAGALLRRE